MDPNGYDFPITYYKVKNQRTNAYKYKYWFEYYHNPIMIGPSEY